jgi:hypothetical protein
MTTTTLPSLGAAQWFFRGLVFGEGTDYMIPGEVTGLEELATRSADKAIPRGDGAISFTNYATVRNVVIPFALHSRSGDLLNLVETFNTTFGPVKELPNDPGDSDWLVFQGRAFARAYRAKVVRRSLRVSPQASRSGLVHGAVQMTLTDPRGYGLEAQRIFVPLLSTFGGGLELPTELPIDMSGGSTGTGSAFNAGNARAWPVIRWQNMGGSDVSQVTMTNETSEDTIVIATQLAPGQTLVADMDALVRRIPGPHISIDGASRYSDWQQPRDAFPLFPGSNIITSVISGEQSVITRLDYRSTYL